MMINKFRNSEKKTMYVERKLYTFYSSHERDLTFYVDEKDNILDVYQGTFSYLDSNILTITDDLQHCIWYDVNTGEKLFKEFTQRYSKRRCHTRFENGIALVYNDEKNAYEVLNNHGEIIGLCSWLYRINKSVLFVQIKRDGDYSLLDYNFNIIKENVSYDYRGIQYNKDYILAARKETEKRNKYYIINTNGEPISIEYDKLDTKDFVTFKYELKKEKKKGKMTLDELLIK
jgi:hypothetical protein